MWDLTPAVDFNKEQLTPMLGENLDPEVMIPDLCNGTGKNNDNLRIVSMHCSAQALTNTPNVTILLTKQIVRGCWIALHFEKDGIDYRIERGRSQCAKVPDPRPGTRVD